LGFRVAVRVRVGGRVRVRVITTQELPRWHGQG